MKILIIPMLAGAMSLAAFQAMAADKVTLQLKWVTQAQFAGYFVAKDKGFYEEEGLEVDIKPGGPDIAPEQIIALQAGKKAKAKETLTEAYHQLKKPDLMAGLVRTYQQRDEGDCPEVDCQVETQRPATQCA